MRSFMKNQIDAEIQVRGKYIRHIVILHAGHKSEAESMRSYFSEQYPKTPISVNKINDVFSVTFGPKSFGIALI